MNPLLQTTIRLTRTLGVAATVVGLLFLSSNDRIYEECPTEAETVEVEILVSCRQEKATIKSDSLRDLPTHPPRSSNCRPLRHLPITATSERDWMNGIGAYLIT